MPTREALEAQARQAQARRRFDEEHPTARMMAKCPRCKTTTVENVERRDLTGFFDETSKRGFKAGPYRTCRNCGAGLHDWHEVRGTYNPAVKCTKRCTGATRPDCECSCAGANHGIEHG